jgi:hypothetical protein
VERWRKQVEEGYQIIYVKDGDKVVAAAGYLQALALRPGLVFVSDSR